MPTFETPDPIRLRAELGAGHLRVVAASTQTTTVDLVPRGDRGEELLAATTVQLNGSTLEVHVPTGRHHHGSSASVDVAITLPAGSDARLSTESGDIDVDGPVGALVVTSGSGEVYAEHVDGPCELTTGSGDLRLDEAADAVRITAGSGDITLGGVRGDLVVKSGSGDVRVGDLGGDGSLKSGSGDLVVEQAGADLVLKSGSGDLVVRRAGAGRLDLTNASGDIAVRVAAELPVWLDLSTVTGRMESSLDTSDPVADGEPYAEIHARTVSGDVTVGRA